MSLKQHLKNCIFVDSESSLSVRAAVKPTRIMERTIMLILSLTHNALLSAVHMHACVCVLRGHDLCMLCLCKCVPECACNTSIITSVGILRACVFQVRLCTNTCVYMNVHCVFFVAISHHICTRSDCVYKCVSACMCCMRTSGSMRIM